MGIQLNGMSLGDETLFYFQVVGRIGFAGIARWHPIGIGIANLAYLGVLSRPQHRFDTGHSGGKKGRRTHINAPANLRKQVSDQIDGDQALGRRLRIVSLELKRHVDCPISTL